MYPLPFMTDFDDTLLDAPLEEKRPRWAEFFEILQLCFHAGWCLLLYWWLKGTWLPIFVGTELETIGWAMAGVLTLTIYPHFQMALYVWAWRQQERALYRRSTTIKLTMDRRDQKIEQHARALILIHVVVFVLVMGVHMDQPRPNWWWIGTVGFFFLLSLVSWQYVLRIVAFKKKWLREHPFDALESP